MTKKTTISFSLMATLVVLTSISCSKKSEAPVADINTGATISGMITIAPELQAKAANAHTLFIIARKDAGPPLAVKKIDNPTFPFAYVISGSDAMFPGTPFQGEVHVTARLDQDGSAGPAQPGDIEGTASKNPATVGERDVDVVINKAL